MIYYTTKVQTCLKRKHRGKANAVKSPELEARFGISGPTLREFVNELRRRGCPICSDSSGYYYAETEAELAATIRQLSSRIGKIAMAKSGLVRAMENYTDDGQTRLPF